MDADSTARAALSALQGGDLEEGARLFLQALKEDDSRLDLQHGLAVCLVQLGRPDEALAVLETAIARAHHAPDAAALALMPQLVLTRAAAHEDLHQPSSAEAAYREVLENEHDNPRARSGLAHLLLAWGRIDEGLAALDTYVAAGVDDADHEGAARELAHCIRRFRDDGVDPAVFLRAHRESYVEFFDHHAGRLESEGWLAEAARMTRGADGALVPLIPEGAPSYAGMRVDLVEPSSGRIGVVGEQPMIVAVAGYEALAQTVLFEVRDPHRPFRTWVGSNCPWNALPVTVELAHVADRPALEAVLGDWYRAGYDGSFGSANRGRFHAIEPMTPMGPRAFRIEVDLGRADLRAIDDLFARLTVLHDHAPLRQIVVGRGHLPV